MTHAEAQVEFLHMDALEFEGMILEGVLEMVREEDGRFLFQISRGDLCARAWIGPEDMVKIIISSVSSIMQ